MEIRELLIIVSLTEALLHYFPWRMLIKMDLPRLPSYTLGLLGLMVPFSVYLIDHNEVTVMQTLWVVIITAGVTVFALYGLDHYLDLERQRIEAEQREKVMAETLKSRDG